MLNQNIQTNELPQEIAQFYQQSENGSYTALKSATQIFPNRVPDDYAVIFVKDGVANVTDYFDNDEYKRSHYHGGKLYKSYMLLRTPFNAPDGHYNIDKYGNLVATRSFMRSPFGGPTDYPFSLDLIRPPFENQDIVKMCCTLTTTDISSGMLELIHEARKHDRKIFIKSNGMGMNVGQGKFIPFDFNIQGTLFFDPLHLLVTLTNCKTRYRGMTFYINQTLMGRDVSKQPEGPLVFGLSWDDCCLIKPIYDQYLPMYHEESDE